MRYEYLTAYWLKGVVLPPNANRIDLFTDDSMNLEALLTTEINDLNFEADKNIAMTNLMLDSMFGGGEPGPLEERIKAQISRIHESRKSQFGNGPYLFIKIRGISEDIEPETSREDE